MRLADYNDAGVLREHLANELAYWHAIEFISGARARRFHGLAKRLARLVGMDVEDVMERLREDAADIEERGA